MSNYPYQPPRPRYGKNLDLWRVEWNVVGCVWVAIPFMVWRTEASAIEFVKVAKTDHFRPNFMLDQRHIRLSQEQVLHIVQSAVTVCKTKRTRVSSELDYHVVDFKVES